MTRLLKINSNFYSKGDNCESKLQIEKNFSLVKVTLACEQHLQLLCMISDDLQVYNLE